MAAVLTLIVGVVCHLAPSWAEVPGEFRPHPVLQPAEQVGSDGNTIQPADTFPKSRAISGDLAPARLKPPVLKPTLEKNDLILNGGWKMIAAPKITLNGRALSQAGVDTKAWYDATVPGTVLGTLVDQGVYPDPYFGLNNLKIPESLNRQDYWYRTEFTLPDRWSGRRFRLDFNGINYYAEIWLNGEYLGHITGAFIRGQFDVTRWLKVSGTNALAVMVSPPPDPGIPSEQSVKFGPGKNGGRLCLDGPTFVCSEGWDWIPAIRDRCTGLWQDVVLHAAGPVTIVDPQVVTKLPLPDISQADISISAELRNGSDSVQKGVLKGSFEGVSVEQVVVLQPGETKIVRFLPAAFPQLTVHQPRLWWPNGYGNPELYHLKLKFLGADEGESDESTTRFGIRELSYEFQARMPDEKLERVEFRPTLVQSGQGPVIDVNRKDIGWDPNRYDVIPVAIYPGQEKSPALTPANDPGMGPFLVVKVNGRKIECLGGNWGMDDALKRISRARLEPYVRLHRDAHLNMIRNWSGQSTSETFYDLCDEYGILVWNDFWMDTEKWNYAPADHELFLKNVADTIKRYRNHPCIAIWCAQNEGIPPEAINQGDERLIRELDGTRYYQPNSRLVNLRSSGPWSNEPLAKYFTELNHGFSTELGASSIPSAEVMRSMMAAADLWPPADVWAYHDFHSKGAGNRDVVLETIARRYGKAQNLDDLCRKAQMVNYETYRAMYEGFNSRLWQDCSGVLVWMSHPSWPSVVWQFYSWDYDPNGSYFGAMKAAEPVHIQMNPVTDDIAVINRLATPLRQVTAQARVENLQGQEILNWQTNLSAGSDACTIAGKLSLPTNEVSLVKLELVRTDGGLLSENFYWHAFEESQMQELNQLANVDLQGGIRVFQKTTGSVVEVNVTNTTTVPALAIRLTLRDGRTGKRVLPVYYRDNYFSLLPGESSSVWIQGAPEQAIPQVELTGWNIKQRTLYP